MRAGNSACVGVTDGNRGERGIRPRRKPVCRPALGHAINDPAGCHASSANITEDQATRNSDRHESVDLGAIAELAIGIVSPAVSLTRCGEGARVIPSRDGRKGMSPSYPCGKDVLLV
jgi:hypothetical protein